MHSSAPYTDDRGQDREIHAGASGPRTPSADSDMEELLEDKAISRDHERRIMYDTASMLEATALLREMENRSDPPSTPASPTPTRKEKDNSSPLTQLELPTCLRVNLTPTKKAPQVIRNAIRVRKNRFKRGIVDYASCPSSSNENSQQRAETAPPQVPSISPRIADNEATPV